MAITFQRHKEAAHNTSKKLPKVEPEQKNTDFPRCCFQARFCMSFGLISMPKVLGMFTKLYEKYNSFGAQAGSEKRCFDCAAASKSRGPSGNHKNSKGNATCEPTRSGCRCFTDDRRKMTSKDSFDLILMTKAAWSWDRSGHRSHHAQELGKNYVFDCQGF